MIDAMLHILPKDPGEKLCGRLFKATRRLVDLGLKPIRNADRTRRAEKEKAATRRPYFNPQYATMPSPTTATMSRPISKYRLVSRSVRCIEAAP
jgi:hypothetical protein